MSRTYRGALRTRHIQSEKDTFRCRYCKAMVGQPPSGGRHRNHCPICLHSRHLDERAPGDRASDCGALMAPIGAFTRRNGEHVLVHRCLDCGIIRHNRIAADDNFDYVLDLLEIVLPELS